MACHYKKIKIIRFFQVLTIPLETNKNRTLLLPKGVTKSCYTGLTWGHHRRQSSQVQAHLAP
jgi:hypothetical protein